MTFTSGLGPEEKPDSPLFRASTTSCSAAFYSCLKSRYAHPVIAQSLDDKQIVNRTASLPTAQWDLLSPSNLFQISKKIDGAFLFERQPNNKPPYVSRIYCLTLIPALSRLNLAEIIQKEVKQGLIALLAGRVVLILGGDFTDGPEGEEPVRILRLRYFDPIEPGPVRIHSISGAFAVQTIKAMWVVRVPDVSLPLYEQNAEQNSFF